MKRILIVMAALIAGAAALSPLAGAQSAVRMDEGLPRVDLWTPGHIPNSKGLALPDSVARNRTWRIGMPRIYVYQPGPEDRSKTAVLVIPGGGYAKQAYETAGDALAKWLNSIGVTAFVLIHRLPNSQDLIDGSLAPTQDAQRALRYIRHHAEEFGIDPQRIGVMGCSSGGHVSACVSTIGEDWSAVGDELDAERFRPDFAILISPVISLQDPIANVGSRDMLLGERKNDPALRTRFSMDEQVTAANPPTLFIHAANDTSVPQQNSIRMYNALVDAGVRGSSLHIFPHGGHAIALRRQPGSTAVWPEIAEMWMKEIGVLEF